MTSNATKYRANRSHCQKIEAERLRNAPSLPVKCYCEARDCHQRVVERRG